ncbi:MAG: M20/M25/M40 family metallo-hydrolase [Planctomycetota bacterium]
MTALVREALVQGQAFTKLESLVSVAPHRLSGSAGLVAAIEWSRQAMLADGLQNVRLQPVLVPHWERGSVQELVLTAPPEVAGLRLPILALGGSVATPTDGLEAEVVEVHSWAQLDELGEAGVRGKLVFFNRPMDAALLDTGEAYGGAVDQRSRGAIAAAKLGGVGAIVRSMTTSLDDAPHTGAMRYDEAVTKVPGAAVSTRGAERLSALLTAGRPVRARLRLDCRTLPDAPSANVIGEIVGRERPEEVVVIGGHIDGWDVGQGAMDDGGGCCQAIEALRLIRSLGMKPRRTIRVVLFTNEENGLRGGRAYHEEHRADMAGHVLAIESDSGPFTPRAFTTDANPRALALLQQIGALLAETGLRDVMPGGGGADIGPMTESGVIVMGYAPDGQRYFDLHHSPRDTIDQLSPRETNLGAACMAAMAFVVADLEETLPRNAPAGGQ